MEELRTYKESAIMSNEKKHTIKDVESLPEGQRAELFDGELVMMASPTTTHQRITTQLGYVINDYVRRKRGKCQVFVPSCGVFLKDDDKNYLEPDITVICDGNKLDDRGCHGAPDWVIEVVSPASRKLDYGRKLAAYIDAGVREYWIVDPEKEIVVVYDLAQPDVPAVYHAEDTVEVGIFEDLNIVLSDLWNIRFE